MHHEAPDRIASDEEEFYVASPHRNRFHRPSCEYARYIPEHKRLIFDSHREAVESGKKPCGQCRA
jgi:methylphosphotriester-DNA--protein-cysteine methyltransferase